LPLAPPSSAGRIWKKPPFLSSRIEANTLGESNRGTHSQSIEPLTFTSAALCMSPMSA
jgi:hypothetical protein